jgi:hypothetical protein
LAYTGLVETPQGKFALIENTSTMETKYAAVGDEVFGMQVVDLDARSVTLDSGGRSVQLAIGENKTSAQTPQAAQTGKQDGQTVSAGQQSATAQGTAGTSTDQGSTAQSGGRFSRRGGRGGMMGGPPGGGMGGPPGM